MEIPRQIKVAIVLSILVLLVEVSENVWRIAVDDQVRTDAMFMLVWISVALAAHALTAVFIYQASRRRNWGRFALLLWTVGSWLLWFVYPQPFELYTGWASLLAAALFVMEFVALLLLFGGRGGAWYSTGARAAL
jgi:hypothetical protein